jgi:hypothetical protein
MFRKKSKESICLGNAEIWRAILTYDQPDSEDNKGLNQQSKNTVIVSKAMK